MADCPLAAVLSTAAARLGEPDLAGLADGLTAPVRARVQGGPGAGVTTTVRVLRAAGVRVCGPGEEPDVDVRVLADPLVAGDGRPDLLVLNKADLSESVATFGIAKATGIPVVAFSALAAAAAVDPATDDRTLSALADALGASVAGADRTAMRAALRRASGVDAVRAAIDRAGAPARYRRIGKVLAELSRRAAGPDGARIADLLAGDDVVLSRMLAAAEVLRAAGMPVPSVPADPLAARKKIRRLPVGSTIQITKVAMKDGSPWYSVKAADEAGKGLGLGWINAAALIGQSEADVDARLGRQGACHKELEDKYCGEIAAEHGLTVEQLQAVAMEAAEKYWPFPDIE